MANISPLTQRNRDDSNQTASLVLSLEGVLIMAISIELRLLLSWPLGTLLLSFSKKIETVFGA